MDVEIVTSSAADLAARIRSGTWSAGEVRAAFGRRVAEREGDVRAWVDRRFVGAAPGRDDGPLLGVPVGVKDIIDVAALPTQMGSRVFAGHRPPRDADVVAVLRGAGASVPGKTVTTEFGIRAARETRNPHDLDRTPGGSSSGSAAAVADGMVPVALGTQTTGSIARPAAFCGVFGFKPTFGTVPREGVLLHSPTLDTVGFLTRHVGDVGLLLDVVARRGALRPTGPVLDRAVRLAFVRTPAWELLEDATAEIIETALGRLPRDRFEVVARDLPAPLAASFEAHRVVHHVETARHIGPHRDRHPDDVTAGTIEVVDEGRAYDEVTYRAALGTLAAARDAAQDALAGVDAIVTACVTGEAPVGIARTGDARLNRVWSAAATPCISVPGLRGPNGLPLGVLLVGRAGEDRHLVGVAGRLARALGYDPRVLPAGATPPFVAEETQT